MNSEDTESKEIGSLGRIVSIFFSPRKVFRSINQKPTYLVPFLIATVIVIISMVFTIDIRIKDKIAKMEAWNLPQERIEITKSDIGSPTKYYIIPVITISIFMNWAILAGILFFIGNKLMKGDVKFEKIYSAVAWSSLIGISLDNLVRMIIILLKGTTHGVTTSLAILLPTPVLSQKVPVIYRILSEINLFTIWQMILLIFGFTIIYSFNIKKSTTLVLSIWAPLIFIKIISHGIFGGIFGL